MRFEQYREQFTFLRDNGITTRTDMAAFTARTEETLANLMKQRTVLNVRKKRHRALYTALADAEALAPARELYEAGLSGMEAERRKLALCRKIQNSLPQMEQEIDKAEAREREVRTNEHRRR